MMNEENNAFVIRTNYHLQGQEADGGISMKMKVFSIEVWSLSCDIFRRVCQLTSNSRRLFPIPSISNLSRPRLSTPTYPVPN